MSTGSDPHAPIRVAVTLATPTAALEGAGRALLDPGERERAARFLHAGALQEYLVGRYLVRTQLSRHSGGDPRAWRFVDNQYGAPAILPAQNARDVRFNLSHTRGLVAVVIADGVEVGVDVERMSRRTRYSEIAHRFFADREVAALKALPEAAHRDRFFTYWTLKEAYIKARGMGLAIPLGAFSFDVDVAGEVAIHFAPTLKDDPARWAFHREDPTDDHRLAVAVASGARPVEVEVRWLESAGGQPSSSRSA